MLLTHPDFTSASVLHVTRHHKKGEVTEISFLLKEIIERLEKIKFITDTLAFGDFKFMVGFFCTFRILFFFLN
jgi:hypothetical protein